MWIKRKITTPTRISPEIAAFAAKLSPKHVAQFVDVQTAPFAKPLQCFRTVPQKIAMDGGLQVNGWIIWEHPKAFLSAEFHAVWKPPEGEIVCVSKYMDGEKRILFVPEPTRPYLGKIVPNRFQALTFDPVVRDFIEISSRIAKFVSGERPVPGNIAAIARKVERLHDRIEERF